MLIPKAPSPANPTTGVSGQPIFAPSMAGKPYPQGPNKPGAKYFLGFSKVGYAFPIAQLFPMSLEIILNQELGEPFRRDAMKKPVKVAGIKKEDMKKQPSLIS